MTSKADLLAALAVFSGKVIKDPKMILDKIFGEHREWLEESVVVQEWLRQGIEQGLLIARREAVLTVLKSRFGSVHDSMEAAILLLKNSERLQALLTRAAVAPNLEDFATELAS